MYTNILLLTQSDDNDQINDKDIKFWHKLVTCSVPEKIQIIQFASDQNRFQVVEQTLNIIAQNPFIDEYTDVLRKMYINILRSIQSTMKNQDIAFWHQLVTRLTPGVMADDIQALLQPL